MSHRKQRHTTMIEDVVYEDLSTQLEVMWMDEIVKTILVFAFDHLNQDEKQTIGEIREKDNTI
ncbi:hypothetical protein CFP56_042350 [Quercus suber]|uniref:Uncharacterized protein n=1 Tax=Quercus suber TaxID=58331 RepID=A0AAW0IU57_QUESU